MSLRRSTAAEEAGRGLYTWDLAKYRMPRHPLYKDVGELEKVKYVNLRFETVEGMSFSPTLFSGFSYHCRRGGVETKGR